MPSSNETKKKERSISEKSLATELLRETKAQTKRWMIAFFAVLTLWAATIGVFTLYLNRYIF